MLINWLFIIIFEISVFFIILLANSINTKFNLNMKKFTICLLVACIAALINPEQDHAQNLSKLWGMNNSGGLYGLGTIFSTDTNGTNQNIRYDFKKNEGNTPYYTKLCEASNGKLYGMTSLGGLNNMGVLFELDTASGDYRVIISFDGGSYGSNPYGSLMRASNGKLYGMTTQGGTNHYGALIEYDPVLDTVIKRFDFDGAANGCYPYGSLVQASNGKLYGMTSQGGSTNRGVLFEYIPGSNTVTKKFDFGNPSDGSVPMGSLVAAANGKLFGMTSNGGLNGLGVIFWYNPSTNTHATVYDFSATKGSFPYGSLAALNDSLYFGLTSKGGVNSYGVLFEYNINSNQYIKRCDFDSLIFGCKPYGSLALATNGNFYGMTSAGGANHHGTLFLYDPVSIILKNRVVFDSTTNGAAPFGSLMRSSYGFLYGMTSTGGNLGKGVIFRYNASYNTYTKKLDFEDALSGSYPEGSLVLGPNGKLFGMTSNSGKKHKGVIFEYDPSTATYYDRYDFDCPTGCEPHGSLVFAGNGKLYGMTTNGGALGFGVLFKYDPVTHSYTKLYDFDGAIFGGNPYGSLIQTPNGKLYGMTKSGGSIADAGTIFSFDTSTNALTKLYTFNGTSNGKNPYGDLVLALNGLMYGMTYDGGTNNLGLIFEFDPVSHFLTVKYNFDGTSHGSRPYGSLIQSSNGNFFGLTSAGGTNNLGTLFEYGSGMMNPAMRVMFDGTTKGSSPLGSLLLSSHGKLYGMTNLGGTANKGVLFEYNIATSTYSKKLDFTTATGTIPKYTHLIEVCESPAITLQPVGDSVCPGSNITFVVTATGNGLTYQWQVDNGAGFVNVTNNITYSGATNDTLSLTNVPKAFTGKKYRCIVTSSCPVMSVQTGEATLTVNYTDPVIGNLNTTYCSYAAPVTLTGTPAGGVFSGSGMVGSVFNPSIAGQGAHQIFYTYTDQIGCAFRDTVSTTVIYENVSFTGLNSFYCLVSPPATLTGSPLGGTFSGPGITGNTFNPSLAGSGTFNIIYTHNAGSGCIFSDTSSVTVGTSLIVSFTGLNNFYCINAPAATLTGNPAGGTFSGTGIAGNTFNPGTAGTGTFKIKYTYSLGPGCSFSDSANVTVGASTAVSFTGLNAVYCKYAPAATLTGNPAGGVFSGAGIVGNTFNPGLAGQGLHQVTYTYADGNNCVFTHSQNVTVNYTAVSFSGLNPSYCLTSPSSTLTGTPGGGVFTGPGMAGNVFTPVNAGAGTHNIIYSYTDGNSCVFSDTNVAIVSAAIPVTISGLNAFYCSYAVPVTLTGTPSGGVFSGAGMAGNVFSPGVAGPGPHKVIYTYTAGPGCVFADTADVTVGTATTVSFSGLNSTYCRNAAPSTLTGSPLGGTFSGPGMVGNVFNPAIAGQGTHQITYTYTDLNNCVFTHSSNVTVNYTAVSFSGLAGFYCITSPPATLTGNPAGGTFSGPGMAGNIFTPSVAGAGTHKIKYSYTDGNSCTFKDSLNVTVGTSVVVTITGLTNFYCYNHASVTVTGTPSGGVFSGAGMTGNVFNPAGAGTGIHKIKYTYNGGSGCIFADSVYVTVGSPTNVSFTGLNAFYCINGASSVLTGNPVGGAFSGAGISGSTFIPVNAGSGLHWVKYSYTDGNNCIFKDSLSTTVGALTNITITGLNTFYCINGSQSLLTGNPSGGTFSGAGITGNTFNPANAGSGPHWIKYNYTDGNNCHFKDSLSTTVGNTTNVSYTGLNDSTCINYAPVTLAGNPVGGSFNGPGMAGNVFTPANAGSGTHTIIYSVTDGNNCTFTFSSSIYVDLCVSVEQYNGTGDIRIYPNPNDGRFTIEMPTAGNYTIRLFNSIGLLVYEKTAEGNAIMKFDMGSLPKGVYFIRMEENNTMLTTKLVIE
jgi:uncharacterized repeat protein (TIGR03803 family)